MVCHVKTTPNIEDSVVQRLRSAARRGLATSALAEEDEGALVFRVDVLIRAAYEDSPCHASCHERRRARDEVTPAFVTRNCPICVVT